jgi:hypothetical protein
MSYKEVYYDFLRFSIAYVCSCEKMKNVPPSSSIFYIGLRDRLIKLLKVTPDEGHSLETSVVASLYQRKF